MGKKEIKSNLRWPGGKSKMMKILDAYLPPKVDRYLEVFTGGGSVLLYVIQHKNPKTVYANDISTNLINYYNTVKNDPDSLIQESLEVKSSNSAADFRDKFYEIDTSSACGFFVKNKTSFGGIGSGYSKLAFDRNFSKKSIGHLKDISGVIQDVNFLNSDFINLDYYFKNGISDYFIYLDPPYYANAQKGLYGEKGNLHKNFDHESLFEWVEKHKSNNLIMMSYDDCEYVREKYKDYFIYNFDFTYSMTNVGGKDKCVVGKEIVITNYEVKVNTERNTNEIPMCSLF